MRSAIAPLPPELDRAIRTITLLRYLSDPQLAAEGQAVDTDDLATAQLPDFVSESGRGLFVVSAFCEKWGWYPSEGGGKVVRAELSDSE